MKKFIFLSICLLSTSFVGKSSDFHLVNYYWDPVRDLHYYLNKKIWDGTHSIATSIQIVNMMDVPVIVTGPAYINPPLTPPMGAGGSLVLSPHTTDYFQTSIEANNNGVAGGIQINFQSSGDMTVNNGISNPGPIGGSTINGYLSFVIPPQYFTTNPYQTFVLYVTREPL